MDRLKMRPTARDRIEAGIVTLPNIERAAQRSGADITGGCSGNVDDVASDGAR